VKRKRDENLDIALVPDLGSLNVMVRATYQLCVLVDEGDAVS
jgi:hypothetical protein